MHPSKYSPDSTTLAEKKAAPKIQSFVNRTVCSEYHAKKITNFIVEMVTLDLQPAAMVEGIGFKRLINYLEPNYGVPSAVHITSCLQEHYAKAKTMVICMLEELMHIALTTDIWTSVATQSYITVTAHFISSSWELKLGAQDVLATNIFLKTTQPIVFVRSYKKFYQISMLVAARLCL